MAGLTALRSFVAREIVDLGVPEGAVPAEDMRRIRILSITTLGMLAAAGVPAVFQYLGLGLRNLAICVAATMAAAAANLALLRARRDPKLAAHLAISALCALLVFQNLVTGGFYDPNFAWLYLLPLGAAVLLDMRGAALWTGVVLALTFAFWLVHEMGLAPGNVIPRELRRGNALVDRVTAIVAIGVIAAGFVAGQRRAERQLRATNRELLHETAYVQLLMHAAVAANEASSFEDALRDSMHRICEAMDWLAGQVFLVREDGEIVPSRMMTGRDERLASLREFASTQTYRAGVGVVGLAVERGVPQVRNDFLRDFEPREVAEAARAAGVRAVLTMPVCVNGAVAVVIQFASRSDFHDERRLREVFSLIGVQLGKVAEREQMQQRLYQSQKMQAVGQLAAGVAHEINNPMTWVRSNLRTLRQEWEALASKLAAAGDGGDATRFQDVQELIDDSLEGVERTIAIVREVREFSHTGAADRSSWEVAGLADLLDGALRVAAAQAPEGVRIEYQRRTTARSRCSPNQIRQVLVNLIVNAIQAVGASGRIRLATGRDGDEVFARVEDDGPGMSAATRERLFDPFFTTKPVGEGTGLGLSVSWEIVRNHGGRIEVTSEPGAGASFEVRLPAAADGDLA